MQLEMSLVCFFRDGGPYSQRRSKPLSREEGFQDPRRDVRLCHRLSEVSRAVVFSFASAEPLKAGREFLLGCFPWNNSYGHAFLITTQRVLRRELYEG